MAAMKPRTGDGPMEVAKEGRDGLRLVFGGDDGFRTASSTSPGRDAPRTVRPTRPLPAERIDMNIDPVTAEQEYDFFAQAAN